MTAPWPDLTVEWAPGYGPFDPSPVFVEFPISDVLSVSWEEGRSQGLEDFPPATARVVLKNDDRRYDPDNTSGPNYGLLLPRVPVRLTAWVGGTPGTTGTDYYTDEYLDEYVGVPAVPADPGTPFQQFTMYVQNGWEQTTRPPAQGTCTLQLIDLVGVIQGMPLDTTGYQATVMDLDPAALWLLDETEGLVLHDSSGNNHDGVYDEVQLGQDALTVGGKGAARFEHIGDWRGFVKGGALAADYPVTFAGWFKAPRDLDTQQTIVAAYKTPGTTGSANVYIADNNTGNNPNGALVASLSNGSGNSFQARGHTTVDDGSRHFFAVVFNSASSISMWVDGIDQTMTTIVSTGTIGNRWPVLTRWALGNVPETTDGDFGFNGVLDDVAVFPAALTSGQVATLYQTGLTGWEGDFTGERAERILNIVGVPSTHYDLDRGVTSVGPADISGDALEELRKLARTEQGGLYTIGHDHGKLRFPDRYWLYDDTRSVTSQGTVTDDPTVDGAVRFEADSLQIEPNGMNGIINQASVSYDGGTVNVTTDSPYGPHGTSITTLARDEFTARGIGEWVVALNETPTTKIRALTILPSGAPDAWPLALEARIGDRISFRHKPLNVGSVTERDFHIEGRQVEVVGVSTYRVTFRLTPVPAVEWARWDISEWDGTEAWAF